MLPITVRRRTPDDSGPAAVKSSVDRRPPIFPIIFGSAESATSFLISGSAAAPSIPIHPHSLQLKQKLKLKHHENNKYHCAALHSY